MFAVIAAAQEAASEADCPPRYAYCGWTGVKQWPQLPDSKCGGEKQSPVNIINWRTESPGPLIEVRYVDTSATVFNSGHDIRLKPPTANNFLEVDGTPYPLDNLHFHTPSEHKVRGSEFPAEAHFVHQVGGRYWVIAVLLPVHRDGSSELAPIFTALPRNLCTSQNISFDWSKVLPGEIMDYYTYEGSLTTPPCTETATFFIANDTGLRLTALQRGSLISHGENARRPLADINDRPIVRVDNAKKK